MLDMQARRRRGAVAIETALMFPLLVLLIFGMIEFGLLLYNRQVLTNASREGARAGIVLGSPSLDGAEIGNVVSTYCVNRLITFGAAGDPVTTVTREGTSCTASGSVCCNPIGTTGDELAVRVTYRYEFLVLTNFGFSPIDLEARTVMRCE